MPITQFWILRELCLNPGKVKSHRELMKAASLMVEPNTIAAHVKSIRRAFVSLDPTFHCTSKICICLLHPVRPSHGSLWIQQQVCQSGKHPLGANPLAAHDWKQSVA